MLEHGKLVSEGKPEKVIEEYLRMTTLPENTFLESKRSNEFWGKEIRLNSISPIFSRGLSFFHFGENLQFEISFNIQKSVFEKLRIGCTVSTLDERPVLSLITNSIIAADILGDQNYKLKINNLRLFPGSYKLSLSIGIGTFQETRMEFDVVRDALVFNIENLTDSGNAVYNWRQDYGNILHDDVELQIV
jgi:hypothetical protein